MSDLTTDEVRETTHVKGQIIMPFYIICDVSSSMTADMVELNRALAELVDDIIRDPVIDDLTMLGVITFNHEAMVAASLGAPSEVRGRLPHLVAGGGTSFGAAWRKYHETFEQDRARLKAAGNLVFRPCVFFLTDGEDGSNWEATFDDLLSREKNEAYPYVVSFGFRDATQQVVERLAYPPTGEKVGRWFLARNSNVGELLKSMAKVIAQSVVSSGQSARPAPPAPGAVQNPTNVTPQYVLAAASNEEFTSGDAVQKFV